MGKWIVWIWIAVQMDCTVHCKDWTVCTEVLKLQFILLDCEVKFCVEIFKLMGFDGKVIETKLRCILVYLGVLWSIELCPLLLRCTD